jgi:hypothetical protein
MKGRVCCVISLHVGGRREITPSDRDQNQDGRATSPPDTASDPQRLPSCLGFVQLCATGVSRARYGIADDIRLAAGTTRGGCNHNLCSKRLEWLLSLSPTFRHSDAQSTVEVDSRRVINDSLGTHLLVTKDVYRSRFRSNESKQS